MRLIQFIIAMVVFVGSWFVMAWAFQYPEFGFWIFGASILVTTIAFWISANFSRK